MAAPLIEARSILLEHPEQNDSAPTRAVPLRFVGTATSTTVVSAALIGSAATNYVGCLIHALNGQQKGQRRVALAFNAGTDTLTVAAWDGTAYDVTDFELWVIPTPFVVASGAGTAGNPGPPVVPSVSAADVSGRPGRASTENWSGTGQPSRYCLLGLSGANVGRIALITGWAANNFTLEAFGAWAAGATGDLYVPVKLLLQHGGEMALGDMTQLHLDREFVKGHQEQYEGTMGPRTGAISFALEVQGPTGVSSGATLATRATEAGDVLDSMMTENRDGATAISGAGSTTTAITVTTATGTQADGRVRIGSAVLVDGEVAFVTAMVDGAGSADTMTVTPALGAAPVAGRAVQGGVCYTPLYPETGHRTHGFWLLKGGSLWRRLYGAMPNIKLEGMLDEEIPRWMMEWKADGHYSHGAGAVDFGAFLYATERFPLGTRRVPRPGRASLVKLNGTSIGARAFTLDLGYTIESKGVVTGLDKTEGMFVNKRLTKGTLSVWVESNANIERFERGAKMELVVQSGSTQGETLAVWMPKVQWTGAPVAKESGGLVHEIPFKVLESEITGNDGSGTIRRIADITISQI
jgi:hypothetical protein